MQYVDVGTKRETCDLAGITEAVEPNRGNATRALEPCCGRSGRQPAGCSGLTSRGRSLGPLSRDHLKKFSRSSSRGRIAG
jgi:hypothetical protein